jgi:hypothetical protein
MSENEIDVKEAAVVEVPVVEEKVEAVVEEAVVEAPVKEEAKVEEAPVEKPKAVKKAKEVKEEATETVALHSTRNVSWQGVGRLNVGYNIVSKLEADQWLTRNHVRVATPEEIATKVIN